jgi:hypothetical protein
MMKMKTSTKETCAEYAVKATQGVIVAAAMPVIFTIGVVGITALVSMKAAAATVRTTKKIKEYVTGRGK